MAEENRESIADLYEMLSIMMKCPDRELLAGLTGGSVRSDCEAILTELNRQDVREQLCGLWDSLEERVREEGAEGFFSRLRTEYTRLFLTPKSARIPIHESIFLIKPGKMPDLGPLLMRSPAAMDAKECYRRAGLAMTEVGSADHMAVELEFEARLWRSGAAEAPEQRLDFETRHLKKWMEPFFAKCEAETTHPFYRIAGVLGQELARQMK